MRKPRTKTRQPPGQQWPPPADPHRPPKRSADRIRPRTCLGCGDDLHADVDGFRAWLKRVCWLCEAEIEGL